jgi:hypothetical protein
LRGVFPHPTLYNRFVYIRTGFINTTEVEKAVDEFLKTLGPEVVRVRYNIGEDWMGDTVLYFRVVLDDSVAVDRQTFVDTAARVRRTFFERLQPLENWGLFPHVSFRSNAEQTALNDPKWA